MVIVTVTMIALMLCLLFSKYNDVKNSTCQMSMLNTVLTGNPGELIDPREESSRLSSLS